jgi:hypothetical protein
MATEKIFISIDNERIELTGDDKKAYLAQREIDQKELELFHTEMQAKQDARESAMKKLAKLAGLTEDELATII